MLITLLCKSWDRPDNLLKEIKYDSERDMFL